MTSIFPLPLTAWEEFLLADDLPGSRKTFVIELSFQGDVDRSALEFGIDEAQARHPLLRAVVERRFLRRPRWVPAPPGPRPLDWGPLDQAIDYAGDGWIDLAHEPGVRFFVRTGGGRSQINVLFHHTCCDGYGAIQFLSDVLTGYVRQVTPDAADLPNYLNVSPEILKRRADSSVRRPPGFTLPGFLATMFVKSLGVMIHRPAPLAVPKRDAGSEVGDELLEFPGSLTQTLDQEVYRNLRRVARRNDATVNDLLLTELLITTRDWNLRHAPDTRMNRLAIVIPTNLRDLNTDGMPAANVVGMGFWTRRASECDDPDQLLAIAREDTRFLRSTRISAATMTSFGVMRRIPGMMNMAINGTFGTIVLSNVGDPWRAVATEFPVDADGDPIFGNLILKDVNSVSPISARTRAAFTIWQACDKLRVGLRCQPSVFSKSDARELLDMYVGRLLARAGTVTQAATSRKAA